MQGGNITRYTDYPRFIMISALKLNGREYGYRLQWDTDYINNRIGHQRKKCLIRVYVLITTTVFQRFKW